jgi:leader peptidase (prepilin peptidase)/N-methyltransferase
MDAIAIAGAVPVGLLTGSVLTMVIDRVPDELRVLGRPRCPLCEHPLSSRELVPVVSWCAQRGRCKHCAEPLTVAYPLVEIVTAFAFALVAARFDRWSVVLPFWMFFATLVAVSTVDVFRYRIPDRIVFPSLAIGLVSIVVVSQRLDANAAITNALVGALLYSGVLFVMSILPGGGMGFGDVKLALVLGLFLGWLAADLADVVTLVFAALFVGSLLGVATGLVVGFLRLRTKREILPDPDLEEGELLTLPWTKQPFPFGPSLAVASALAVLSSNWLI